MRGGQIVALIFAILLLLPGGCVLLLLLADSPIPATREDYQVILPIVAAIMSPSGLLFWIAFKRRRSPGGDSP